MMNDSRLCTLLVLLLALSWPAFGQAGDSDGVCERAQSIIAQTSLVPTNVLHDNYEPFVESKSSAQPFETQQYYSHPLPDENGVASVVSCKMRTGGSIADAHPRREGQPPVAGKDLSCAAVTADILARVQADLGTSVADVVIDEEQLTFMGPMWLDPWPFQSVYRSDDNRVHLASKALYVPWAWYIPAPPAFKGVYYCHLVAPDYLRQVLRGEVSVPALPEQ